MFHVHKRKGATSNSVMFSLIQTAIENGLNSYRYLIRLMRVAKGTKLSQEDALQPSFLGTPRKSAVGSK